MLVSMDMAEYLATVAMTYSVCPIVINNTYIVKDFCTLKYKKVAVGL